MGNGMNKVVDGLYIGDISDAKDRDSLSENGITHILSLYKKAKPIYEDITYLCIDAEDFANQNLIQHFKKCISFVHDCRLSGGSCLVHCLAGVSRSSTMVVAYLMTVTDYCWNDCLYAVRVARFCVKPNNGFEKQLHEYQMTQVSEYRAWLQSSYRPSPFKDQEQVGALLRQHKEEVERIRAVREQVQTKVWSNQGFSAKQPQ